MKTVSRLCIIVLLSLVLASAITSPIYAALDDITYDQFAENDIIFYHPQDMTGLGCDSASSSSGSGEIINTDYNGGSILTNAQIETIKKYQIVYEQAAAKYDFPWQALAVLHLRETSLRIANPDNGQGIYQLYSLYSNGTTFPSTEGVDVSDEEFLRQSMLAAEFFKGKNPNMMTLGPADEVKKAFFAYNGQAGVYKTQAQNLGFTQEQANMGEGSPYVMNRADAMRDPTVEPTKTNQTWGQIKSDGGSISYPANRDHGAFVVFSALSGISPMCSGGLVSGGMNLEQAKEFVKSYSEGEMFSYYEGKHGPGRGDQAHYGLNLTGCAGGSSRNCVAFSEYFINKYTTNPTAGMGGSYGLPNGSGVVERLVKQGFTNGGTTPRAYAVFSIASGRTMCGDRPCGHTGVVLGIDEARGKIIIGEAGCRTDGVPGNPGTATEQELSKYTSGSYTFAYTDSYLKGM